MIKLSATVCICYELEILNYTVCEYVFICPCKGTWQGLSVVTKIKYSQIFQHEIFVIYGEQKVTTDDLQVLLKATVITGP